MGFRKTMSTFSPWLKRPLFGTVVIPPDARVDARQFSEEEFPVWCPKCDYRLRGIPDGPCPECGEPFEHGRLLVQQYVSDPIGPRWRHTRTGRVAQWGVVALVSIGVLMGGVAVIDAITQQLGGRTAKTVRSIAGEYVEQYGLYLLYFFGAYVAFLALLGLAQLVLLIRVYIPNLKKRRKIAAAIPSPENQEDGE